MGGGAPLEVAPAPNGCCPAKVRPGWCLREHLAGNLVPLRIACLPLCLGGSNPCTIWMTVVQTVCFRRTSPSDHNEIQGMRTSSSVCKLCWRILGQDMGFGPVTLPQATRVDIKVNRKPMDSGTFQLTTFSRLWISHT